MKIVIDSNRVIAALIKESTTREILFDETFEFIAPDFIKSEIEKYKEDVIKKAKISEKEFSILFSLIFEHITIIPGAEYKQFIEEIKYDIKDPKDIPYLAVSLSYDAKGLWSHDPHFKEQNKVKIFTNIEMIGVCESKIN